MIFNFPQVGYVIVPSRVNTLILHSQKLTLTPKLMVWKAGNGTLKKWQCWVSMLDFWGVNTLILLLMAEILRSPVEVGSLSHYLQGFSTIPGASKRWLFGISAINSMGFDHYSQRI